MQHTKRVQKQNDNTYRNNKLSVDDVHQINHYETLKWL